MTDNFVWQFLFLVFEYPVSDPDHNRLYMWGLVEHGALGTFERTMKTEGVNCIAKPSRSTFGEMNKVYNMACGYGFSALAVRGTEAIVYGCGINTDTQIGNLLKNFLFCRLKNEDFKLNKFWF